VITRLGHSLRVTLERFADELVPLHEKVGLRLLRMCECVQQRPVDITGKKSAGGQAMRSHRVLL
jgi:hypothetical protein